MCKWEMGMQESNKMERESLFCESCGKQHHRITYKQLSLRCPCGAINDLPPAPPIFERVPANDRSPRLQWYLHGEDKLNGSLVSLLQEGGACWVTAKVTAS